MIWLNELTSLLRLRIDENYRSKCKAKIENVDQMLRQFKGILLQSHCILHRILAPLL